MRRAQHSSEQPSPMPVQLQQTSKVGVREASPLKGPGEQVLWTGEEKKSSFAAETCCVLVIDRGEAGRAVLHPLHITRRRSNSANCIKWSD